MDNRVSIRRCSNYEDQEVERAVNAGLSDIGGIDRYIKPGMKVLLKCNLLMKKSPEESATTHPRVAVAVARAVRKAGAVPIVADSPGGPYTRHMLSIIYKGCGFEDIAQKEDIQLNYNTEVAEVKNPHGRIIKNLRVIGLLKEVDAVISIPKLKTHGMLSYTGAVKNMFGIIPGVTKAEYHLRMKRVEEFSEMLLDICQYSKPVLTVMDAVVGMEGQGPSAGDPRYIGAVITSPNPYALDIAAVSIVGIPAEKIATIIAAYNRGLCSMSLDGIKLMGDSLESVKLEDFKVPQIGSINFFERFLKGSNPITETLNSWFGPRPVFSHQDCVGCRHCEHSCPPGAIKMHDGKPVVDLKMCIRCYCCQELCPEKAVTIKRSLLFRSLK